MLIIGNNWFYSDEIEVNPSVRYLTLSTLMDYAYNDKRTKEEKNIMNLVLKYDMMFTLFHDLPFYLGTLLILMIVMIEISNRTVQKVIKKDDKIL